MRLLPHPAWSFFTLTLHTDVPVLVPHDHYLSPCSNYDPRGLALFVEVSRMLACTYTRCWNGLLKLRCRDTRPGPASISSIRRRVQSTMAPKVRVLITRGAQHPVQGLHGLRFKQGSSFDDHRASRGRRCGYQLQPQQRPEKRMENLRVLTESQPQPADFANDVPSFQVCQSATLARAFLSTGLQTIDALRLVPISTYAQAFPPSTVHPRKEPLCALVHHPASQST